MEFIRFLPNFPIFQKKTNFPGGPSGFSRDFRTEISCFVPILRKIPVEWTKKITKKETKNCHHEQSPSTRISLPVANFQINPQSSWVQMALLPMETEYRGSC
jgi:hypothetical protein